MDVLQPPRPVTVRELIYTALTERRRLTRQELERAAALQGHSGIAVEIALNALVRAGALEQPRVFALRVEAGPLDEEPDDVEPARARVHAVDYAESARLSVEEIIERMHAQRPTPPPQAVPPSLPTGRRHHRARDPFWGIQRQRLQALPTGETLRIERPEREVMALSRQLSVMLRNHRDELPGRFTVRTLASHVSVTRLA